MSGTIRGASTPLMEESPYNGKIYRLGIPQTGASGFDWFLEELPGREFDIKGQFEVSDRDDLQVPKVFQPGSDEDSSIFATIGQVSEFDNCSAIGIIGDINHREPSTVKFEGNEYLVLNDASNRFLIFKSKGRYYMVIFGSREIFSILEEFLETELEAEGFTVSEISVNHAAFEDIADDIVSNLKITTVEGFPKSNISKKRIMGYGYEDEEDYQEEVKFGSVSDQQFGTEKIDGSEKTVQISQDCLVRCYHSVTLSSYVSLLAEHAIPHVRNTVQSPIYAYTSGNNESQAKQNQDD